MHLGIGIMSYLSSPLWLVMLCIGFALAVQSHLIRPEYFNHDFQMFPTWPRFNVELMMALFWFSMLILFVPKFLGLSRALLSTKSAPRRRRSHRPVRELPVGGRAVGAVCAGDDAEPKPARL